MNKFLMMLQKHKMFHITGSMSFLRDCEKKINNEIDWNFALKFIFCILFIFYFLSIFIYSILKKKNLQELICGTTISSDTSFVWYPHVCVTRKYCIFIIITSYIVLCIDLFQSIILILFYFITFTIKCHFFVNFFFVYVI